MTIRSLAALAVLLIAAAPLQAQVWRGSGRAQGTVRMLLGEAIAGARVWLVWTETETPGPPAVTSDAQGRWAFTGLASGRWEIRVEAEGFQPTQGWIQVSETPAGSDTNIRLRPLDEVSPGFSEGNPATVRAWLEKGNVLLEQQRFEAAREEYEKALRQLPDASKPEVLRTVARTYFLQGDAGETLRALRQALYFGPEDETTRQLYSAVLGELDRSEEARSLLADLDRSGSAALDGFDLFPQPPAGGAASTGIPDEIARLEPQPAEPGRRGRYRVILREKNPATPMPVVLERLGVGLEELESVDPDRARYDPAAESFHVFVPDSYEADGSFGLFVWVSPTPFGGFVSEDMRLALEEHKLIWVGADGAGNPRIRWVRAALALDAAHNMRNLYELDPDRIYVGGYSGGGRVTSGLVTLFAETFRGGFSFFGCDYFRRVELPDRPGAYWPAKFPEPERAGLERLRVGHRFVLLTGELDFNRFQTRAIYERMLDDGFEHVTYLEIPGASHYTRVPGQWLERGFSALDGLNPGARTEDPGR